MDQRVSMITLPVRDVPAASAFYQRLGWTVTVTDGDIVMFQAGGMIVSLWWQDKLDVDGGVAERGGYGHASLAYAVDHEHSVAAVCAAARPSPANRGPSPSAIPGCSLIRTGIRGRSPSCAAGRCSRTAP